MQLFKKKYSSIRGAYLTENVLHYAKMCCDKKKNKLILCKGICEAAFKKSYSSQKKYSNAEKPRTIQSLSTS